MFSYLTVEQADCLTYVKKRHLQETFLLSLAEGKGEWVQISVTCILFEIDCFFRFSKVWTSHHTNSMLTSWICTPWVISVYVLNLAKGLHSFLNIRLLRFNIELWMRAKLKWCTTLYSERSLIILLKLFLSPIDSCFIPVILNTVLR